MPISQERFEQYKKMKQGQGVDMARFEAYKAMKAAQEPPKEMGVTEQVFTPLSETAALTGAGLMASRLAPTAAKIGMRGAGAIAVPVMGLVGGGLELAKMTGEAIESSPNAPKTSMEALSRLGSGAWKGVSGEIIGQGIGRALGAMVPSPKTAAQVVRVATGVPEREASAVLANPKILSRAKSVGEAGEAYQKALESSKSVKLASSGEGSRVAFGKTMLSPEATLNKYDELLPKIQSGELDLQSALALRQTASHHLGKAKGDWYDAPMREVLDATDKYLEKGLEGFPEAVKGYREAKIAEEFGSWLPLNKNLSPNVLRTAGALAYAGQGAARGDIIPSVMAAGVSPKVWGYGIQAGAAATPAIKAGANVGARATGYVISSTEELLRKKYMEQK